MPPPTFSTLHATLLASTNLTHPPAHPHTPSLTAQISALALHPTLEAALHILNHDLPSAHFLVRHLQAAPALEGMLLHSILHRSEGDMQNARLWLSDVGDACSGFVPKKRGEGVRLEGEVAEGCKGKGRGEEVSLVVFVYGQGGVGEGLRLVDDVEGYRKRRGGGAEGEALKGRIREEMGRVLEWCVDKFGSGEWADASSAWVKNSDEVQKISNDMVGGDKGYRKF
ncbi:hypothetical protein ST47_g3683 [Ascochyta rabiei]|uniref:Uncharacterized protein n=2 Tax=Didymella rabiei TaxID=5454 RepID=A0A163H902_DIDRA|nr:hypothetical protein ST47_g3683 [Ascochyta rabiei]